MKSCPRAFEAEAMRDGRLGEAERTSFERHRQTCAACKREVEALDGLSDMLREANISADELRDRRERTRLLAAFDESLVTPERSSFSTWGRLLVPAVAFVALVALAVVVLRRDPLPPPPASSTPNVVVHGTETAVWTKHLEGTREKIVLERGTLSIRVTHTTKAPALLVVLPDGELEDTGTTFRVTATSGHTSRIVVEEGSVVLRLRGEPEVKIVAGETWTPKIPSPMPPPSASAPPKPAVSASVTVPPPSSATPPDPAAEFRTAMAMLDRGENTTAAASFAEFVTKHPADSRAEDAMYLRVIALQRSGDTTRMKEAAVAYVQQYPNGFRRTEVEPLAR